MVEVWSRWAPSGGLGPWTWFLGKWAWSAWVGAVWGSGRGFWEGGRGLHEWEGLVGGRGLQRWEGLRGWARSRGLGPWPRFLGRWAPSQGLSLSLSLFPTKGCQGLAQRRA